MTSIWVETVVEGSDDAAALRKLLALSRVPCGEPYVQRGKAAILKKLPGFNAAARGGDWIVLLDLDRDADCAPTRARQVLRAPEKRMHLRVVVRALEAWLLADAFAIAEFLRVARDSIPPEPESLDDPKGRLVELARQSRSGTIRREMVPTPASGGRVGTAYTGNLIDFIENHWRPEIAQRRAPSLARCIRTIEEIARSTPSR